MRLARREKVFGPGRAVPLDRNAKVRVMAYARAWSRRHAMPGQPAAPSPAPSWTSWGRSCGVSATAAPASASRATCGLPRGPSAPARRSPRR